MGMKQVEGVVCVEGWCVEGVVCVEGLVCVEGWCVWRGGVWREWGAWRGWCVWREWCVEGGGVCGEGGVWPRNIYKSSPQPKESKNKVSRKYNTHPASLSQKESA